MSLSTRGVWLGNNRHLTEVLTRFLTFTLYNTYFTAITVKSIPTVCKSYIYMPFENAGHTWNYSFLPVSVHERVVPSLSATYLSLSFEWLKLSHDGSLR